MLRRLYVENFLLIKDLELEFGEGLNVLSGETGTGKSMTISAVGFVLGSRGDFPEGTAVELEVETDGETFVLRREIRGGRSRYFLNGRGTTSRTVREMLEGKISIQGQNEFTRLLRPEFQRELLDRFGGLTHLRNRMERLYRTYSNRRKAYEEVLRRRRELLEKRDFLEFKLREIEEIGIDPEELEELKMKAESLRSLERIKKLVYEALGRLYDAEGSAYSELSSALRSLWKARELDPTFDSLIERLSEVRDRLLDLSEELRSRDFELSPEEIDRINEVLFKVQRLEKKYGKPYSDIFREAEEIRRELSATQIYDEEIGRLEEELAKLKDELQRTAIELSTERRKASLRLEEEVTRILRELNLERARLKVELEEKEIDRFGMDRVRILFSSSGRALAPVERVASGGEMTRLFLALSLILPPSETYIFDEIDAGISGETSLKLAKLLKRLSKKMQIVAITHSAPTCAAGDVNYLTEKEFIGDIPYVRVRRLSEEEKIEEVARLMGATTENTIRGARELVELVKG